MYLLGSVRKLKNGDYICFIGKEGSYAIKVCRLPSNIKQYLTSKKGYILLVREIPKKTGGVKRYYYKIPERFLSIDRRGAFKVFKINTMFVYEPDTLFQVEDISPTGHKVIEYEQKTVLGMLFEKASNWLSTLFKSSEKKNEVKKNKVETISEKSPIYPSQQVDKAVIPPPKKESKESVTSLIPFVLIPLFAIALLKR